MPLADDSLHRLVLDRLESLERSTQDNRESIERKIDTAFHDASDRIVKLETKIAAAESWIGMQQMAADVKAARAQKIAGHLTVIRQWTTFGIGTAVGAATFAAAFHLL